MRKKRVKEGFHFGLKKSSRLDEQNFYIAKIKHTTFEILCSHVGAAVVKIFNKYRELSLLQSFLKTMVLFSRHEVPAKKKH